jgi:hypothetical protein
MKLEPQGTHRTQKIPLHSAVALIFYAVLVFSVAILDLVQVSSRETERLTCRTFGTLTD